MEKFSKFLITALALIMALSLAAGAAELPTLRDMLLAGIPYTVAEKEELIDRGHFAYVVSANQKLNMETEKYYAELTLINETGLFEVTTVEDVENYNFMPTLQDGYIGKIRSLEGKFVQFDMRKTDKIQKLEPRTTAVSSEFSAKDGFYLVNIIDSRNGVVTFYDTAEDVTAGAPTESASFCDKGYAIIGISGDRYAGEILSKASARAESFAAGAGNAVIQMEDGEIVRVFSFTDGYEI